MNSTSQDQPQLTAIDELENVGLSTYAARTFVALMSLGEGTAKDISMVSDVPRTRVYDATEELHDRGLVDIQHTTPKRFGAVSVETATRRFHLEHTQRMERLTGALEELEPQSRTLEQEGVWTVTGRKTIDDRVAGFIQEAREEVVFMTVEKLLEDRTIECLQDASTRGVSIKLARQSELVNDEIQQAIPDVELFQSIWEWTDLPAGRLLMVDKRKTLASVLLADDGAAVKNETAIWATGERNSLVMVLKALFTWQLDGHRDESTTGSQQGQVD